MPEPVLKEKLEGRVEFRDVCFCYGDEMVLKNVSFSVEPGETVAILGPPAAEDKHYQPDLQVLRGNQRTGADRRHRCKRNRSSRFKEEHIGCHAGRVPVFKHRRGEYRYGVPDAPFENIQHAAQIADADEFIMSMPEEYSTIIGERGVGLSGGQNSVFHWQGRLLPSRPY